MVMQESQKLSINRLFTVEGVHPYDELEWELRHALIVGVDGKKKRDQENVEFPSGWSMNATSIVADKYFREKRDAPDREFSAKQIIDRVTESIRGWGIEQGRFASEKDGEAFAAELTHILVNQTASFNSPVWFNIGWYGRAQ